MKKSFKFSLLVFFFPIMIMAQDNSKKSLEQNAIIGTWKIDLRPTPQSEAYYQYFKITETHENTIDGTFYGSPIKNGLINKNWNRLYFAFSTSDSSNDYFHSGYILNEEVHGISYCPNRDFTAPWTGVKE